MVVDTRGNPASKSLKPPTTPAERLNRGVNVMGLVLLIILILLLIGAIPAWPYSRGWGYYPSGGLGLILLIVIILLLLRVI
jgi:hypothetical protein